MIQDVRVGIRDEEWNGCGSFDGNGRIQDTENGLPGVLLPDTSPREELHHPRLIRRIHLPRRRCGRRDTGRHLAPTEHADQSVRSASTGSTFAARRAGTQLASAASITSSTVAPVSVIGSVGLTS